MKSKEKQLPFSFNNDREVKSFRDSIRDFSNEDLKLLLIAVEHEDSRRKPKHHDQTKEALAGFLDKISFDYFCTFTTRKPISLFSTRRIAEKVCDQVHAGVHSSVFWCAEDFDVRDGFHFHALMKIDSLTSPRVYSSGPRGRLGHYTFEAYSKLDLFNWYHQKYGRCQIIDNREPDRQMAASHYVSKYVTKRITDYDFRICKSHLI